LDFGANFRVGSGLSPGLVLTGSSEDFGLILDWVPSIRGLDYGLNSERPLLDHRLGFGLNPIELLLDHRLDFGFDPG